MWKLNNSNYTNGQLNRSWFTKKWIEQKNTEQGLINQIGNCPTCSFNKYQLPIIYPVVNWTGTNWTILSPSPLSVEAGLAQISRAYGQRAKLQTRARPGFALLARVKKLLHPSHLWLGFIVVWTNCGLDQLWFRSIVVWIVSHFWLVCHCYIGICSTRYMFKMRLGESNFGQ